VITAVVVALASTLSSTSAPAFCAEARALVAPEAALNANDAVRALARALEVQAPRVVEQANRVAAAHGDLASALPVYAHAVRVLCDDSPRPDAAAARAAASEILDDDVFHGTRAKSDILDLIIARGRAWLLALLESAGMQRYAGFSRGLYLVVVCTGAVLLALRVLRERRRRVRLLAEDENRAPAQHRALRTARALLDDAERARARGALTDALAFGEAALLAVLPASDDARGRTRTHGEILRALPDDDARAVAPVLSLLSHALFAGRATANTGDTDDTDARNGEVRAFIDGVRAFLPREEGART
jgi:hypothetical protein